VVWVVALGKINSQNPIHSKNVLQKVEERFSGFTTICGVTVRILISIHYRKCKK